MILPNIRDSWTNKNSETLVSCFPTSEPLLKGNASTPDDLDVMASAITSADLERCENVIDLLSLLAHRSINRVFEGFSGGFVDILSIYRWAAANKVCDVSAIFARYLRY